MLAADGRGPTEETTQPCLTPKTRQRGRHHIERATHNRFTSWLEDETNSSCKPSTVGRNTARCTYKNSRVHIVPTGVTNSIIQ